MGMRGLMCAVQAGVCAALASVCGKLALTPAVTTTLVERWSVWFCGGVGLPSPLPAIDQLVLISRVVAAVGIVLFNAIMWTQFTKSMHLCSSTLQATASTTSSNFVFTALLGQVLFNERLGLLWYAGSVFVILGLVVLHQSSHQNHNQQTKKTL